MATQDTRPVPDHAVHGNRRILVIDGDRDHQKHLSRLLHRLEYRSIALKSAAEARRSITHKLPDLVILHLPAAGEEDLAFLRMLRLDSRTDAVPIIAITSSGDREGESLCLEAGATGCLAEPFEIDELYFAIQKAVERIPRRNLRISLRTPVTVNGNGLDCGEIGCNTNISVRGMYIQTKQTRPEREHLVVRFWLGGRPIQVHAHVLFSDYPGQALGRESGMGLYFTDIAPEDEAYIRKYINDAIMAGA